MSRQHWGTFSVRDHLQPYAFITEVFLYDRLIIPHPADNEDQQKQKKFIYTVASSVASELIKPLAPLVKTVDAFSDYHAFPKFAHDQTIPDKYKPAAMFYDIHRHFGWS